MSGTAHRRAAERRHLILKSCSVVSAAALVAAIASAPVRADDPVSTNVSFNREIIRIIQRKCEPCHASGGLAFSLSDYREARVWSRAIREELVEHRMPPAIVARGYGEYESDPSLNAREMATFLTWLDGGMPRGDEADRPPAIESADPVGGHQPGTSVRLALPPQDVPAGEGLVVRRVTIDAGIAAGRRVARVEFRPGNRRVLRGADVFAASGSAAPSWTGSWSPWQHALVPPASHAFALPPGATLVVDVYYRGADTNVTDSSELDVIFAGDTARGRIDDVVIEAASERSGSHARGSVTLAQPVTIWAVHPSFDASVSSIELRAERPDGSVEVLLWIPRASVAWPLSLVMQEPVRLPAGSRVVLVAETNGGGSGARGIPQDAGTRPTYSQVGGTRPTAVARVTLSALSGGR
jgi:hypothetical protein